MKTIRLITLAALSLAAPLGAQVKLNGAGATSCSGFSSPT